MAGCLLIAGAQHAAIGHWNGAAGRVTHHSAGQVDIGDKGLEGPAGGQRSSIEADCVAVVILRHGEGAGVVGTGMAIDPGQHHRIVGGGGIEGRQHGFIGGGGGVALVG